MIDLGFGLLDRRTVIAVVLTMTAAQILLGNTFPIDGTNVITVLADLVLLTGFLYLARSVYRLPLALVSQLFVAGEKSRFFAYRWGIVEYDYGEQPTSLRNLVRRTVAILLNTVSTLLRFPFHVMDFGNWVRGYEIEGKARVFQVLDRVGLVIIAVLATFPQLQVMVKQGGLIGIVFMILVFVFRGTFSAIVADLSEDYKKKEEKKPLETG